MTDKTTESDTMPGSGAGDAAHSTRIPRIERPSRSGKSSQNGKSSNPRPGGDAITPKGTRPGGGSSGQTDKGRPRKPQPTGKSGTRPLSAADYANAGSGSSTATMPAEKDAPAEDETPEVTPEVEDAQDAAVTEAEAPSTEETPAPPAKKPRKRPAPKARSPRSKPESAAAATETAVDLPPVPDDVPPPAPTPAAAPASPAGTATLRLARVEPWSVTRMAFAVSVALMIVAVVATAIFWVVAEVTGVWGQIDGSVTAVLSDGSSGFSITDYLGFWRLIGAALVLSALNVVIMTFLATVAAHMYNLLAQVLGGFKVTYVSDQS